MTHMELNSFLKTTLRNLVEKGYKKTIIGKTLLGRSGFQFFIKWLDDDAKTLSLKSLSDMFAILPSS